MMFARANVAVSLMMSLALMMSASPNVFWQASHHCEKSEQHHYAKHNIISLQRCIINFD